MTIFDLIKSQETAAYWTETSTNLPPFLGEELVDTTKQLSTDIKFIKGASKAPVMLKQSAYDAKAVPRGRIGFETLSYGMPFFKESMYVDEQLQRELNQVLATGNQPYIDSVMQRIMDDNTTLLNGARVTREIMLWQALTTGAISLTSNGQNYSVDYEVPSDHKSTVTKSWSDDAADIIGDIRTCLDKIEDDTGVRPTRMVISRPTLNSIMKNTLIKKTVFVAANVDAYLSEARLKSFILEELDVSVAVYDKRYMNSSGTNVKFVPDDMAIFIPNMKLGTMTFAPTPEEDAMSAGIGGDVSIVDTGVAVTTIKVLDPVTIETKVSQVVMPSLPHIDKVFMLDIVAASAS